MTNPVKDPAAPVTVKVERTYELVVRDPNAGKRAMLESTVVVYRRAVEWFARFVFDHERLMALDAKATLSKIEEMTIATRGRTAVAGWDFTSEFGPMPRDTRRAAINAAVGAVKSHLSAVGAWEKAPQRKRGRRPKFGLPGHNPVLYAQDAQVNGRLYREGFARFKAHNPTTNTWEWLKVPVAGRPDALALLEEADAESDRQTATRKRLTEAAIAAGRIDKKGRADLTKAERAEIRLQPGSIEALSPTLVVNRNGISLNIPFRRAVEVVRAEPGRLAGFHERVVTVDINTFNVTAVAWDGDRVLKVHKISFGQMQSVRERQVGKAIGQSRKCRGRNHGERQSVRLWRQIGDLGETIARQVAAWVVTFAEQYGATVIVTEHLGNYRPERGTASKRANRRRSYWLRGKIHTYLADRAITKQILVVQRNASWTSQQCPHCHKLGERFSQSLSNPTNQARFQCQHCGWAGDADIVGALNLHRKWLRTFVWPTQAERDEVAERRRQQRAAFKLAGTSKKSSSRGEASATTNPSGDSPSGFVVAAMLGTPIAAAA